MKPNIDRKGRIARGVSGGICLIIAVILFGTGRPESDGVRWGLIALLGLSGVFQLFEARKGWCVARACGLKTPM
jgi:hypothetical protein